MDIICMNHAKQFLFWIFPTLHQQHKKQMSLNKLQTPIHPIYVKYYKILAE